MRDKEEIAKKKDDHDREIERMHGMIQSEDDERRKREKEESERQDELERKKQEKLDMEDAARYIQRKWQWYQEVGRFMVKKKKGRKGGKKKKK